VVLISCAVRWSVGDGHQYDGQVDNGPKGAVLGLCTLAALSMKRRRMMEEDAPLSSVFADDDAKPQPNGYCAIRKSLLLHGGSSNPSPGGKMSSILFNAIMAEGDKY